MDSAPASGDADTAAIPHDSDATRLRSDKADLQAQLAAWRALVSSLRAELSAVARERDAARSDALVSAALLASRGAPPDPPAVGELRADLAGVVAASETAYDGTWRECCCALF